MSLAIRKQLVVSFCVVVILFLISIDKYMLIKLLCKVLNSWKAKDTSEKSISHHVKKNTQNVKVSSVRKSNCDIE